MKECESRICSLLQSCCSSRLSLVQKVVRLNYESWKSAWAAPRRRKFWDKYKIGKMWIKLTCFVTWGAGSRKRMVMTVEFPFPKKLFVSSFVVLSNQSLQNPKVVSPWDEKGTPKLRNSAVGIGATHFLKRTITQLCNSRQKWMKWSKMRTSHSNARNEPMRLKNIRLGIQGRIPQIYS